MAAIPCPFVYANGKRCTGRIIRIEVYKADVDWQEGSQGHWEVRWSPRSHYHLFCSERGNHAGYKKQDDDRMKFYYDELPSEIQSILQGTRSEVQATTDAMT